MATEPDEGSGWWPRTSAADLAGAVALAGPDAVTSKGWASSGSGGGLALGLATLGPDPVVAVAASDGVIPGPHATRRHGAVPPGQATTPNPTTWPARRTRPRSSSLGTTGECFVDPGRRRARTISAPSAPPRARRDGGAAHACRQGVLTRPSGGR